jgi:phage gp36-like protein
MAGTAAVMTDDEIQTQINYAQARVDGVMRGTYNAPLTAPVPEIVFSITADISAYLCDLSYRKNKPYSTSQTPILLRYQQANLILTQIGNGSIQLDVSSPTDIEDSTGYVINQTPYGLFSPGDFGLPDWPGSGLS